MLSKFLEIFWGILCALRRNQISYLRNSYFHRSNFWISQLLHISITCRLCSPGLHWHSFFAASLVMHLKWHTRFSFLCASQFEYMDWVSHCKCRHNPCSFKGISPLTKDDNLEIYIPWIHKGSDEQKHPNS